MEHELDIGVAPDGGRQRRRRRKSTASSRSRAARFERRVVLVMCAVLIGYLALGLLRTERQVERYGGIAPGMNHDDVRSVMGPPARADAAGQRWIYEEGGTIRTIAFAGDRVVSSSCELAVKDLIACPAVFGIGAGAGLSDLHGRLGPADHARVDVMGTTLFYDGLGYSFLLREETVIRITHRPRGPLVRYLRNALWQAMP